MNKNDISPIKSYKRVLYMILIPNEHYTECDSVIAIAQRQSSHCNVTHWYTHGQTEIPYPRVSNSYRSYHQPRWRRPKTVRPNNRGYQENLTVCCVHMTLTNRCHITLCFSAMTMCFSSAGDENLHIEIFRKLVVTVRPCWSQLKIWHPASWL